MKTTKPSIFEPTILPSFKFYERIKLAYAVFTNPRTLIEVKEYGTNTPLTIQEIQPLLASQGGHLVMRNVIFDRTGESRGPAGAETLEVVIEDITNACLTELYPGGDW
jgi:hypothetical protein